MMNRRKKTILTASIMTLGLISVFTIGLSSWIIVTEGVGGTANIRSADIENEDLSIRGFSVSCSGPKLGKYFFENGSNASGKSNTGTLMYTVSVTNYASVPASLKGKNLYFFGSLSLLYKNGTESNQKYTSFFDDAETYISKTVSFSGSPKTATYESGESMFTLPQLNISAPLSQTTSVSLEFTLNQQCILNSDIRSLLLADGTHFHLELKVGTSE